MSGRADVLIVGAGPAGLFAAFQLGLFDIGCLLVDSRARPGGQCSELYPDKPIYDMPGHAAITAQELVDRLMLQLRPFAPRFLFDTAVVNVAPDGDGFRATTGQGNAIKAAAIVLATGMVATPAMSELISEQGAARVDAAMFQTPVPGVFAIGDCCRYPAKLPLLVSAFHEAALMTQAVRQLLRPATRPAFKYTSASPGLRRKLGPA